jgi:hypothetical protein
MLKALAERRMRTDFLIGTSAGALNAACLAGQEWPAGIDELEHIWLELSRSDVFPMGRLGSLLGPVADALRASSAIPRVFPPVRIGHHYLMDGGVANNAPLLQAVELGAELGFTTTVVGPVRVGALEVNSTRIRRLIAAGDLRRAAALLGRSHFLSGVVVPGDGRGRRLGFPTANLKSATECVPPHGIYATRIVLPEATYPSATSIGVRPTFGRSELTIETYIFDFDRDLYGARVRVEFVERIRDELRFESVEALKEQMALDVRRAREILVRA